MQLVGGLRLKVADMVPLSMHSEVCSETPAELLDIFQVATFSHFVGLVPTMEDHPVSISPAKSQQSNCTPGIKGGANVTQKEVA